MPSDQPYFDAWLRRTRRQFAISGRLSQVAAVLSVESGECPEVWRERLRNLLEGEGRPSLDLLTRIDRILAKPGRKRDCHVSQHPLFDDQATGGTNIFGIC